MKEITETDINMIMAMLESEKLGAWLTKLSLLPPTSRAYEINKVLKRLKKDSEAQDISQSLEKLNKNSFFYPVRKLWQGI